MKKDKIGVYIHIPFCVRKCRYCGFLSFPGYPKEMYETFTEAAVRELKNFNEGFVGKYEADTVFIGGGTPSLLSGEQIGRLLDAVRDTFGISGSGTAGGFPRETFLYGQHPADGKDRCVREILF